MVYCGTEKDVVSMPDKSIKIAAAALVAGLTLAAGISGSLNRSSENRIYAQTNMSGEYISQIKKYILDDAAFSAEDVSAMDLNHDGEVNLIDFQAAKRMYISEAKEHETTSEFSAVTSSSESVTTPEITAAPEITTTPEVTTTPVVTTRPQAVQLDVGMVLQNPELPTGCEATSLTMLLSHKGFDVSKGRIADLMPKMDFYSSGGVYYGADFITTFPGNPRSGSGYGCYAPCMVTTAERYFESIGNSEYYLRELTGSEFDELYNYVAAGNPVMVWATMSMIEPRYTSSWTTPSGKRVTWLGNEHCLVLTGYDTARGIVYVNDPLKGKVTYGTSVFSHRYDQMGRYAAVLEITGK